ncbi:MAG: hypothetical protein OET57_01875 [Desulfobacteraceae bacterium]|jgi:hypothetical protein|nr:hypothetical protein [Desulfobacteraceae bacterium]MDH3721073.1 hypothetical protein [Desulfobacteraceae bacterium]MDH3835480.1 hypothetical protein [Desulfobacteraceae bacterium]
MKYFEFPTVEDEAFGKADKKKFVSPTASKALLPYWDIKFG